MNRALLKPAVRPDTRLHRPRAVGRLGSHPDAIATLIDIHERVNGGDA